MEWKIACAGVRRFVHAARAQPTRGGRIRDSSFLMHSRDMCSIAGLKFFGSPTDTCLYMLLKLAPRSQPERGVSGFSTAGRVHSGDPFGAFWRIDGLRGATSSACGRPVLPIGPLECSRSTRTSAHGENGEMGFLCQEMGPRSALASAGGRPVCQIHSSHVKKREGRFALAERGMRSGEQ